MSEPVPSGLAGTFYMLAVVEGDPETFEATASWPLWLVDRPVVDGREERPWLFDPASRGGLMLLRVWLFTTDHAAMRAMNGLRIAGELFRVTVPDLPPGRVRDEAGEVQRLIVRGDNGPAILRRIERAWRVRLETDNGNGRHWRPWRN